MGYGTRQNAGRICGADQNGDNLRIGLCGSVNYCSDSVRVKARVRIRVSIRVLRVGLRIVVYKLLEKVTKCGSVT